MFSHWNWLGLKVTQSWKKVELKKLWVSTRQIFTKIFFFGGEVKQEKQENPEFSKCAFQSKSQEVSLLATSKCLIPRGYFHQAAPKIPKCFERMWSLDSTQFILDIIYWTVYSSSSAVFIKKIQMVFRWLTRFHAHFTASCCVSLRESNTDCEFSVAGGGGEWEWAFIYGKKRKHEKGSTDTTAVFFTHDSNCPQNVVGSQSHQTFSCSLPTVALKQSMHTINKNSSLTTQS